MSAVFAYADTAELCVSWLPRTWHRHRSAPTNADVACVTCVPTGTCLPHRSPRALSSGQADLAVGGDVRLSVLGWQDTGP
jgi:hypothetical protein